MSEICYMCDAPAVGKEHVPPRCLFPKQADLPSGENLRKNLLTVPSCQLHNSEKSGEDAYFLNVLTSSEMMNQTGVEHYRRQIRRQNARNPSIISRFAERKIEINGKLGHQVEIERLDDFINHLARALYYVHFGEKWEGNVAWFPEFLVRLDSVLEHSRKVQIFEIDDVFNASKYFGSNPDVFVYQVIDTPGCQQIRLHFYGGCRIFLTFDGH